MLFAYPLFVVVSLIFTVLTYLLAPFLALFVSSSTGNLPKYLLWFQTFDATCFEGREPQYGMTGSNWWVATRWLWRNPGYTFDLEVLGFTWNQNSWKVVKVSADGSFFFAIGPWLTFNLCGMIWGVHFKFGWKAWNMYSLQTKTWTVNPTWAKFNKIPVCFTPA